MDAFAKQFECPNLVEPQIILRSKHTHNSTNGKGSDCDRKHRWGKPWRLSLTWCFHKESIAREKTSARATAKSAFEGSRGLAIQEAFNKRLFFGKKLVSLELRCFGFGVFQIRSSS